MKKLSKKEEGLMDMNNSVVTVGSGRRKWVEVEEGIRGIINTLLKIFCFSDTTYN